MANEIQIQEIIRVKNGPLNFEFNAGLQKFDQAASGGPTPGFVTVGTTEESVAFAELGTLGLLVMQNLDATNFIEWGFSTGVYGGRMEPGETARFRLKPGTTLYLKADTAACKALVYGFEN